MNKFLKLLNIRPDKNQRLILISLFTSGLLYTYTSPTIAKELFSKLPAQWIAFQALATSLTGLLVGMTWRGKLRHLAVKYFAMLAITECTCGLCVGLYLAFIKYDVWILAISSLIYTNLIATFVGKCIMTFKSILWPETEREIYDNNTAVTTGIVCTMGYATALIAMPTLKTALTIWATCCVLDDAGWIAVYIKNRKLLTSQMSKTLND